MVDIIHRIGIQSPVSRVYTALSTIDGLAGWWTRDTTGISELGRTIEFRFVSPSGKQLGAMGMQVTTLDQDRRVQWRCTSGPKEWIDTDVVFDLHQDGEQTLVLFGHKNWREAVEFTAHCSMKWATFLLSLRELVETGKGKPSPDDMKIDNWN
jgi:uncharacterized protein YndB with AHSA1/START domain